MFDIGQLFNSKLDPSVIYSYWKKEPTEAESIAGKVSLRQYALQNKRMSWEVLLKPKNREQYRTLYSSIATSLKYIDTSIGLSGPDLDILRNKWGFGQNNQPFFKLLTFILNNCSASAFINRYTKERFCTAYEIYVEAPRMIHERMNVLALPNLSPSTKSAFAKKYNDIINSTDDDSPVPEMPLRRTRPASSTPPSIAVTPAQETSLPPELVFFEGFMKRFTSDELTILHKYIGETLSKK